MSCENCERAKKELAASQAECGKLKEILAGKPVLQTAWEHLIEERDRFQAENAKLKEELQTSALAFEAHDARLDACHKTITKLKEELKEADRLLREAAHSVCRDRCPSIWKTAEGQPHTDECKAITAYLAKRTEK